jgi:hypothetical protein
MIIIICKQLHHKFCSSKGGRIEVQINIVVIKDIVTLYTIIVHLTTFMVVMHINV